VHPSSQGPSVSPTSGVTSVDRPRSRAANPICARCYGHHSARDFARSSWRLPWQWPSRAAHAPARRSPWPRRWAASPCSAAVMSPERRNSPLGPRGALLSHHLALRIVLCTGHPGQPFSYPEPANDVAHTCGVNVCGDCVSCAWSALPVWRRLDTRKAPIGASSEHKQEEVPPPAVAHQISGGSCT